MLIISTPNLVNVNSYSFRINYQCCNTDKKCNYFRKITSALLKLYLLGHTLAFAYLCFSFFLIDPLAWLLLLPLSYIFVCFPIGPATAQLFLISICGGYMWAFVDISMVPFWKVLVITLVVSSIIALKIYACLYFWRIRARVGRVHYVAVSILYASIISIFYGLASPMFVLTAVAYSFALDIAYFSYIKLKQALEGDEKALKWTAVLAIVWTVLMWIMYPIYSPIEFRWHETTLAPPLKPIITITWTIITILQTLMAIAVILSYKAR